MTDEQNQTTIGSSNFEDTADKENPLLKIKTFGEDSSTNKMMSSTVVSSGISKSR